MFGVENRVGRLVETHTSSLASAEEMGAFNSRFREIVSRMDSKQIVICADYRRLRTLSPEMAERVALLLTVHNPRVERGAILCAPQHAAVCSHLERAVTQSNHGQRRAFREPADAIEWLGEVLTDDERNRLIDFLASNRQ